MKKGTILISCSLFFLLLTVGCGSNTSKENQQKVVSAGDSKAPDNVKNAIHFELDGREINSTDYSCSWMVIGGMRTFNLTVFYDRIAGETPPHIGFNIYNLSDIKAPINRLNGQLPRKSPDQIFSLVGSTVNPKGKPADMDKTSFSDNYKDLQSTMQITRLDTVTKTCAGRFEGTLRNEKGDVMKITNGSFENIPYKTGY